MIKNFWMIGNLNHNTKPEYKKQISIRQTLRWKNDIDYRNKVSKSMSINRKNGIIRTWNKGLNTIKHRCKKCGKILGNKKHICKPVWNKGKLCHQLSKEKNSNWRGGTSFYWNRGLDWYKQRKLALQRDNYKCQKCSSKKRLNVHHIIDYRLTKDNSLHNLITLCTFCHSRKPTGGDVNG